MAKKFKGENSKVTAAKEKKAVAAAEKEAAKNREREKKEAEEWSKGAKKGGKKEVDEAKRAEKLARKAELEALKMSEERELSKLKPKGGGARATGMNKKAEKKERQVEMGGSDKTVVSYSASNVEDAIDALSLATETGVGAKGGPKGKAGGLDKHPERRHKAAWAAYQERELPRVQEERPGLRRTQYREMMWKQWQKSPDNPFNQETVAYNAKSGDVQEARQRIQDVMEARLRDGVEDDDD